MECAHARLSTKPGDSMLYQHSVSGIGCSGSSPTTTPPNINACSSSTPPLANSNPQSAPNHETAGNQDQMVSQAIHCANEREPYIIGSR